MDYSIWTLKDCKMTHCGNYLIFNGIGMGQTIVGVARLAANFT
jgi:hypothetical protein